MRIDKRHSDILTNRLEHILDAGCVHILWNELYRWYGVRKIAARTYRDIADRWQEVSEGLILHGRRPAFGSLKMVKGGDGVYLFAEKTIKPLGAE